MNLAFLYAGQGAQHLGMGAELYTRYPAFANVWDRSTSTLDFDLKELCLEGPAEKLDDTRYTQPCMVAFAAGVTAVLYEHDIHPGYAAGLSLGEYSALHAAGAWDAQTTIALAAFRGEAMARATQGRPCKMAAILGLSDSALDEARQAASSTGTVEIANRNCPGQRVIGGDTVAVDRCCELALAAGARRCIPLHVSGPFHTSLMHAAGEALAERLALTSPAPLRLPVLFNCIGAPMGPHDDVPSLLVRQVQSGVRMEETIRWLADHGVDRIIEIGPGKTLAGFVRKTCREIEVYSIDTADDLEDVLGLFERGQQHGRQ